jgi:hypothetical protein
LIIGQIASQIRHDIALATIPSLISDSRIHHEASLGNIAVAQNQVLPTLLSDADRGMRYPCKVPCYVFTYVDRGSEVFVSLKFRSSRREYSAVWLS